MTTEELDTLLTRLGVEHPDTSKRRILYYAIFQAAVAERGRCREIVKTASSFASFAANPGVWPVVEILEAVEIEITDPSSGGRCTPATPAECNADTSSPP